jgi:RND family efflux transporter MFP subunit
MNCYIHKKKYALILTLVILAAFFTGCAKKAVLENAPKKVKAAVAERITVNDEISGFGSLSFITKVDIAAPHDAAVKQLFFREGDFARRGEIVCLLENPQIRIAVEHAENTRRQAEAALALTKSRLCEGRLAAEAGLLSIERDEASLAESRRVLAEQERKLGDEERLYAAGALSDESIRGSRFDYERSQSQIDLMERELAILRIGSRDEDLRDADLVPDGGFVSEKERRRAQISLATASLEAEVSAAAAYLDAAWAELRSARQALADLTVVSPASGVVGARYYEEGERIKQGEKIITLMDGESLYALFPLREADALRLQPGMKAVVAVDGTGGEYEGTVDLVSPQADSRSFNFTVRVLLPPSAFSGAGDLKPGMFARVVVDAGPGRELIAVPDSAVVKTGDERGAVFVISGQAVSERQVRFGEVVGGKREIRSGLASGEVVVLRPDSSLKEGSNVSLEK